MLALRFLPRISLVRSLDFEVSQYSIRAISHLGFMIFIAGGFSEAPVPFENTNWLRMPDQPVAACAIPRQAQGLLPKFHLVCTNRLRASQNAAVLVIDSGTVDIR